MGVLLGVAEDAGAELAPRNLTVLIGGVAGNAVSSSLVSYQATDLFGCVEGAGLSFTCPMLLLFS